MNRERLLSWRNRWLTHSVGAVAVTAVVAAAIGFALIPTVQESNRSITLWDAICRAAGTVLPYRQTTIAGVFPRSSDVIVTAQMMRPADALSVGRGATLAMQCTMCHGVRGMSLAGSPNLAGQVDAAVYKQLRDFKAGHRVSAIMAPLVANLDDRAMRDLAAYYAYLPRERTALAEASPASALVRNGSPMRGIGACASCHGAAAANVSTPRLDGEPASYIESQLQAFASGARHNDINAQMRNVARHLSAEEISAIAQFYSAQ